MVEIDGSLGEGGGQVLRTALALSSITGKPITLENIRAGRKQPGLQAQHLTSVDAAQAVCKAEVQGAYLGSTKLTFVPHELRSSRYRFEIPTAGSTSLVLQTIFFPLSLAGSSSSVIISGGTHVAWAPSYHYLAMQWLPTLESLGWDARLSLELAGFYPKGGGRISATIRPAGKMLPINLAGRGALLSIRGVSAVANLDQTIAERMKRQATQRLQKYFQGHPSYAMQIKIVQLQSPAKGAFIELQAEYEHGRGCFTSLGALGKPAERVADEAIDALIEYAESQAAYDAYLGDQLLLPLALATENSHFTTTSITQHLVTNAKVIHSFLPVDIDIRGEIGQPGEIYLAPIVS
jgi:RNA 3'-terminal phosphate cyclase (ATP)